MTALWSDTESSGYIELSRTIANTQREKPEGGFVKSISIGSFLQLFEMEQKTCLLEFRGNGKKQVGFFYFVDGVLHEAVCGELKGREAALRVIGWDKAEIRFHEAPKKKISKRIDGELMGLIMEAMRLKDESDAEEADAHEMDEPEGFETEEKKLLNKAIFLAEGFYFRDARKALTKILRHNPNNFNAWLWYSRISTDLKTINRCLQNAKQLSPNDQDLILEIRKFELANKSKLADADLHRCPFCWCILKTGFYQCPFCNAFLRIDGTFLACRKYADKPLLDKAINRYREVAKRTKDNFNVHYYLGLAHVNLENWDDAIRHLTKAVDLSSRNPFFSEQLNCVLIYSGQFNTE
jgi:tetratricopeptide (TPR) repeat protein